jgi:hypothetical protein
MYCVARAADGGSLAIALVAVLGDVGVLVTMIRRPTVPASSAARYLLHLFVVSELAARKARHLVVASAFTEPPGRQYFQHLLGFHPRHVRLVDTS